jgi:hypothetical protein
VSVYSLSGNAPSHLFPETPRSQVDTTYQRTSASVYKSGIVERFKPLNLVGCFSKHVIHAVGPVYSSAQQDIKAAQLSACYSNSLGLALEHNLATIVRAYIHSPIHNLYDHLPPPLRLNKSLTHTHSLSNPPGILFYLHRDIRIPHRSSHTHRA